MSEGTPTEGASLERRMAAVEREVESLKSIIKAAAEKIGKFEARVEEMHAQIFGDDFPAVTPEDETEPEGETPG